ncbi:MAG TPA: hypothetical protein VGP46_07900, partial [Acidimicrobiales bacterium]|nr:hypothetical protein [Acidimicrobiales bacterium]
MRPTRRFGRKRRALLALSAVGVSALALATPAGAVATPTARLQQSPAATDSYTLSSIACLSASSCKAGGYYGTTFFNQTPLAEGWNGSKWATEPTEQNDANPTHWIYGTTCVSSIFCWAVGSTAQAVGGSGSAIAELWQGKRWSQAAVPSPPGGHLGSVSCFSMSLCWAVGGFQSGTGAAAPLGELWSETDEGSKWASDTTMPEPKGATAATLTSVSCTTNTTCLAVGHYTSSSGAAGPFAERLTQM